MQEVLRQAIIPDLMQLEHGIRIRSAVTPSKTDVYIGSLHVLIADHPEACDAAGIRTGTISQHRCSSFTSEVHLFLTSHLKYVVAGSNVCFPSRHTLVPKEDYPKYLLEPNHIIRAEKVRFFSRQLALNCTHTVPSGHLAILLSHMISLFQLSLERNMLRSQRRPGWKKSFQSTACMQMVRHFRIAVCYF